MRLVTDKIEISHQAHGTPLSIEKIEVTINGSLLLIVE